MTSVSIRRLPGVLYRPARACQSGRPTPLGQRRGVLIILASLHQIVLLSRLWGARILEGGCGVSRALRGRSRCGEEGGRTEIGGCIQGGCRVRAGHGLGVSDLLARESGWMAERPARGAGSRSANVRIESDDTRASPSTQLGP